MSKPSPLAAITETLLWPVNQPFFQKHIKPFLTPYYLVVAGVLGAATAGFVTLIIVLLIIATNFNVLGAIE
jgi:hypothetical protein